MLELPGDEGDFSPTGQWHPRHCFARVYPSLGWLYPRLYFSSNWMVRRFNNFKQNDTQLCGSKRAIIQPMIGRVDVRLEMTLNCNTIRKFSFKCRICYFLVTFIQPCAFLQVWTVGSEDVCTVKNTVFSALEKRLARTKVDRGHFVLFPLCYFLNSSTGHGV